MLWLSYFLDELGDTFEICPVCFWEDDLIQNNDASFEGGANEVCLKKAKENFQKYGAIEQKFIKDVRKPHAFEIPTQD